jgi:hypothetical protein
MSNDNPAAPTPHPESEKPTPYDRLIDTLATLECVLSVLERESDKAACDSRSHVPSAEIVLRRSIRALYDISGDVEHQQRLVEKMRGVVT